MSRGVPKTLAPCVMGGALCWAGCSAVGEASVLMGAAWLAMTLVAVGCSRGSERDAAQRATAQGSSAIASAPAPKAPGPSPEQVDAAQAEAARVIHEESVSKAKSARMLDGGYWETCCSDGEVKQCYCPRGAFCNFGQNMFDCMPPRSARVLNEAQEGVAQARAAALKLVEEEQKPEGTWEPCCSKGKLTQCFCPTGARCNYGRTLRHCKGRSRPAVETISLEAAR